MGFSVDLVVRKLKKMNHQSRTKFLNNHLYNYLESIDLKFKQDIADMYLWDQSIHCDNPQLEKLVELGLIQKINGQYKHYEAIRKYCMDYVTPNKIEQHIKDFLEYYCVCVETAAINQSEENLKVVFIEEYNAILFALQTCYILLTDECQAIVSTTYKYSKRMVTAMQHFDGLFDIETHKRYYAVKEIVDKMKEESVFYTEIIDWQDLWTRLL
ncbi:Conserved_hypothetical protein [Hexamita inflata]|uniref:Uncharacterized protein n=1 Tax=Hexamita inflata TaxID=28002 RepID=A0AA86P1X7_9EUKA|nr:Conserved hypothetical protein [Hexamita inflata]